ncbi:MAG: aminotransferase class I/II-fold pyridoxal phosphate-dependent enzyme, partial [Pseudomonadota bacterium]
MRTFPFSQTLSRKGTGSIKWEKYSGKEVLPMWVADMELATSDKILAAMKDRLEHPILGYTTATDTLKKVVTDYLQQHHQWQIDPDWLVWLPGVVPGLSALTSLLAPDDQIMVFTPVYHPLLLIPQRYRHTRVDVPLRYEDHRWHIDFDAFERSINTHCRMLFLCSPHNPVGTLFTEQELTRLAQICADNNILLISDEIHCDLVLDTQRQHVTTGRVAGDTLHNLITLMSPSKTFNLAGA